MPRIESDLLGTIELDDETLFGIQTERARRHFNVSGEATRSEIISAMAIVKRACARANAACGFLSEKIAHAIEEACVEIEEGKHCSHFVIDAMQGGAGTSTNMNVNEVIANRASQIAGERIDSLEHVNLHQSTNDTYPTAVKVAAIVKLRSLEHAIVALQESMQNKEREFASVVKLGRTQLRDAVPTTLGREFGAWANALARDRWRVFKCIERIRVINLGGTAIGTGIAAPRDYIFCVTEILRELTGLNLARAENLIDATQNNDAFVEVSGIIRTHATNLIKFARDIRLMNSGPHGGLGEINVPSIQPGSSIMPGKINPVVPEMVMQVGMRVMAHDVEITSAVSAGELELNPFLPLIADALIRSLDLLERTDRIFAASCIDGITANEAHCRALMERSQETATALIPVIGHRRAIELARHMSHSGKNIREAVADLQLLPQEELDAALQPERLCALGWTSEAHSE